MTVEVQLVICVILALAVLTAVTPRGRRFAYVFAGGMREAFSDPIPPIATGIAAGTLGLGFKGSILAILAYIAGESRARRGTRRRKAKR